MLYIVIYYIIFYFKSNILNCYIFRIWNLWPHLCISFCHPWVRSSTLISHWFSFGESQQSDSKRWHHIQSILDEVLSCTRITNLGKSDCLTGNKRRLPGWNKMRQLDNCIGAQCLWIWHLKTIRASSIISRDNHFSSLMKVRQTLNSETASPLAHLFPAVMTMRHNFVEATFVAL